ncbi:hypothetical protein MTO96_027321 [Rhipicephalus appendiculatus]
MRNWDSRDAGERCVLDAEESDVQFVCDHLEIPMKTVDFVKTYWHNVFSTMLDEYQKGWTPNPDMLCNRTVKFGVFHEYATRRLGADLVATGHYARLHPLPDGRVRLMQGIDDEKDQSFFLAQVKQEALQRSLFPLGDLEKATVKQIATDIGLHKIATKKESMGLCFIGKRDFRAFVEQYLEPRPGSFVDMETGKIVGTHTGVHSWTVGQRCHIGGCPVAYYVAWLCPRTQCISVVPGQHHPALYWRTLYTDKPHWVCGEPPWQMTGDTTPSPTVLVQDTAPGQPSLVRSRFKWRHHRGCSVAIYWWTQGHSGRPSQGRNHWTVYSVVQPGWRVLWKCQDSWSWPESLRRTEADTLFFTSSQRCRKLIYHLIFKTCDAVFPTVPTFTKTGGKHVTLGW